MFSRESGRHVDRVLARPENSTPLVLYPHFGITPEAIVAEARRLLARQPEAAMSHRIVFLDRATIAPRSASVTPCFRPRLIEHGGRAPDEVAERLAGASIAITNKAPMHGRPLGGCRR